MWKAMAIIALLGAGGCTNLGSQSTPSDYSALLERGEALYNAGRYNEAHQAFYDAAHAVDGKGNTLFVKAGARAAAAFCMTQFEGAKADIASKDFQLALLEIDTALADSTCLGFKQEVQWARAQKALLETRP